MGFSECRPQQLMESALAGNDAALAGQAASEFNRLLLMEGEGGSGWMGRPMAGSSAVSQSPSGGRGGFVGGGGGAGAHHARSYSHHAMTGGGEHVGWGGQAIPDNGGYRVPWFGRSRGKSNGGRNKARARLSGEDRRGSKGSGNGRWGGGRHGDGDGAGNSGPREDVLSVEEVTSLVRGAREGAQLPERVYSALHHFDSRTASVLLKDLSKVGLGKRAVEIFDWLRRLEPGHSLAPLCDVYTYTAMISMCIYQHNVERALELAQEMRDRNVERNVHTYTALMNVCIKCGKCHLALETYNRMRQDNIVPNVVTYNTLIDVYGKMGQWEQAVKVLALMKNEVRTRSRSAERGEGGGTQDQTDSFWSTMLELIGLVINRSKSRQWLLWKVNSAPGFSRLGRRSSGA